MKSRARAIALLISLPFFLAPSRSVARNTWDSIKLLRHAHLQFFPLPIVATTPNEGQTYGALPVLVATDLNNDVMSVFAGALTWNSVTKWGGFLNWLISPSIDEDFRIYGGASQAFYREASLDYAHRSLAKRRLALEEHFQYWENPFERFYGFGPKTPKSAQSNFTSLMFHHANEAAVTLWRQLAAVVQVEWNWMRLQPRALDSIPDTATAFAGDPEVMNSNQMLYRFGARWNSLDDRVFSSHGFLVSALGIASHALQGPPTTFTGYAVNSKFAWQPHRRFTTVGNFQWQQLFGDRIPFTLQSSLGGDKFLRGFVWRRFADHHVVGLDLEERIHIHQWHFFGTDVSFSIDPFVSVGETYRYMGDLKPKNFEATGGVGFRMRADPSVVGRVDFAYGRDGLAIYTTLDYPF